MNISIDISEEDYTPTNLETDSRFDEAHRITGLDVLKRKALKPEKSPPAKRVCHDLGEARFNDRQSLDEGKTPSPTDLKKQAEEEDAWRLSGFHSEDLKRKATEPEVLQP